MRWKALAASAAIAGLLAINAGAAPAAAPISVNGSWTFSLMSARYSPGDDKPSKSKNVLIGNITDDNNGASSPICLEFNIDGQAVVLEGTRHGSGFFVRSQDGQFVISGQATSLQNSQSARLRGIGSRLTDSEVESLTFMAKRNPS
ncbi:MAG: hypothetical protein ACKVS6_04320 [Planctomycetota bacterium]